MTGTVKLIQQGEVKTYAEYSDKDQRNKIIESWKSVFKFENCAIQIKPDVVEKKEKEFLCEK